MLPRILCYSTALTALFALSIWFSCIRLRDADFAAYRLCIQQNAERMTKRAREKPPIRQKRSGVTKDLWKMENGYRRLSRIYSQSSTLTLLQKKGKMEGIEDLEGIECSDTRGSLWRADRGQFHFPSLACNLWELSVARLPFHLTCVSAKYHAENKEIRCLLPKGVYGNDFLFQADSGHFLLSDGLQPAEIFLEGNVCLASQQEGKEGCALSDRAIFQVKNHQILLLSTPSKRVLFRQKGLELSAPELRIQGRRDAAIHSLATDPAAACSVQGIGDVRFSLETEERALMDKICEKFL